MTIGKTTRFEVFKRDKFTCQYCGRSAPDVVLELDHIMPRSKGGSDDILNLVTSCFDCNRGKRDKLLSDDSTVKMARKQLDLQQDKEEQMYMLVEWQRSLADLDSKTIEEVCKFWSEVVPGYRLEGEHSDYYRTELKKFIRRFGLGEVLKSIRISADQYLVFSEDTDTYTPESAGKVWEYVERICINRRKQQAKPYLQGLYYARGILKNRKIIPSYGKLFKWESMKTMETAIKAGATVFKVQEIAKAINTWEEFEYAMEGYSGN